MSNLGDWGASDRPVASSVRPCWRWRSPSRSCRTPARLELWGGFLYRTIIEVICHNRSACTRRDLIFDPAGTDRAAPLHAPSDKRVGLGRAKILARHAEQTGKAFVWCQRPSSAMTSAS